MKISATLLSPSSAARWPGRALIMVLVCTIAAQAAAPRAIGRVLLGEGRQSEERSDPTESADEEIATHHQTIAQRISRRDTRGGTVFGRAPFAAHQQVAQLGSVDRSSLAAELASRNGIGGPLRC